MRFSQAFMLIIFAEIFFTLKNIPLNIPVKGTLFSQKYYSFLIDSFHLL